MRVPHEDVRPWSLLSETAMHEIGLCKSFLDAVEQRAAGRQVIGVRLRIGTLHHVVEPALTKAFAQVSAGTVAEGAAVEMVAVPVRMACLACGRQWKASDASSDCPTCGAPGPEVTGGDELTLEWIRVANAAWGLGRRRDVHAAPTA